MSNIEVKTLKASITPGAFFRDAKQFLEAAKAIEEHRGSTVPHFLCCRAIELSLKGFLIDRGMRKSDLRGVGHDIKSLCRLGCDFGILKYVQLTDNQIRVLLSSNRFYLSTRFAYFDIGWAMRGLRGKPDFNSLFEIAEIMITKLEEGLKEG